MCMFKFINVNSIQIFFIKNKNLTGTLKDAFLWKSGLALCQSLFDAVSVCLQAYYLCVSKSFSVLGIKTKAAGQYCGSTSFSASILFIQPVHQKQGLFLRERCSI